jgi:hypothetical protein
MVTVNEREYRATSGKNCLLESRYGQLERRRRAEEYAALCELRKRSK